jgi:hypothetical protein
MASAISAEATGAPPGESTSIKIAFIWSSFSASSMNFVIFFGEVLNSSGVGISPTPF